MKAMKLRALIVAGLLVVGCGSSSTPGVDAELPSADAGVPVLSWTACPFSTNGSGSEAECANVEVPINWDDPDGDTIVLFVKRVGNFTDSDSRTL